MDEHTPPPPSRIPTSSAPEDNPDQPLEIVFGEELGQASNPILPEPSTLTSPDEPKVE